MQNINDFIKFLACPITKTELLYDSENNRLVSIEAKLAYPIIEGIPILLPEKAIKLTDNFK